MYIYIELFVVERYQVSKRNDDGWLVGQRGRRMEFAAKSERVVGRGKTALLLVVGKSLDDTGRINFIS